MITTGWPECAAYPMAFIQSFHTPPPPPPPLCSLPTPPPHDAIGAAKGKQSKTMAACQHPPPPRSGPFLFTLASEFLDYAQTFNS